MDTTVPTGSEQFFVTMLADLKAMPPADLRIYLRSPDVSGAALAALTAYPLASLLVPPNVLTDARGLAARGASA